MPYQRVKAHGKLELFLLIPFCETVCNTCFIRAVISPPSQSGGLICAAVTIQVLKTVIDLGSTPNSASVFLVSICGVGAKKFFLSTSVTGISQKPFDLHLK